MASGATARIAASPHSLTVVYPPERAVATGTAPGSGPAGPLIPVTPSSTVETTEPVGYLPTVTLKCLWLDMASGTELAEVPEHERRTYRQLGWTEAATALARVLVSEAATDPSDPYAGTVFDRADHVEFHNNKFFVLQIIPISASFRTPESYYVWLSSTKQH